MPGYDECAYCRDARRTGVLFTKPNMQPYQQRVIDEKNELDEKLTKLRKFLATDQFRILPEDERRRLVRQCEIMGEYSLVLRQRITAF